MSCMFWQQVHIPCIHVIGQFTAQFACASCLIHICAVSSCDLPGYLVTQDKAQQGTCQELAPVAEYQSPCLESGQVRGNAQREQLGGVC